MRQRTDTPTRQQLTPAAAVWPQGMSDDDMTVQQFRQRCVDPMGEESDHVHIVALTNALQACRFSTTLKCNLLV